MMKSMLALFLVGLMALSMVSAYKNGPPVDSDHATLCQDMFPSGHDAKGTSGDAPYTVTLSDTCYKASDKVQVMITATHTDDDRRYFEGFFTQAQEKDVDSVTYGTFTTEDTEHGQTHTCNGVVNGAIAQKNGKHFLTRLFTWVAPATGDKDLYMRSTIVKGKSTFWMEVMSAKLEYKADCVNKGLIPNAEAKFQPKDGEPNAADRVHGVVSMLLASLICVVGCLSL